MFRNFRLKFFKSVINLSIFFLRSIDMTYTSQDFKRVKEPKTSLGTRTHTYVYVEGVSTYK